MTGTQHRRAMSAFSRMAQEMDEAISGSVLDRTSKGHGLSTDREGGVEELEVGCSWTVTQSDGEKAALEEEENWENMKWKLRWKWMQACHKERVQK